MARGQITRQLAAYRLAALVEDSRQTSERLSEQAEYLVEQAVDVERKRTQKHGEVIVLTYQVEPGDD